MSVGYLVSTLRGRASSVLPSVKAGEDPPSPQPHASEDAPAGQNADGGTEGGAEAQSVTVEPVPAEEACCEQESAGKEVSTPAESSVLDISPAQAPTPTSADADIDHIIDAPASACSSETPAFHPVTP